MQHQHSSTRISAENMLTATLHYLARICAPRLYKRLYRVYGCLISNWQSDSDRLNTDRMRRHFSATSFSLWRQERTVGYSVGFSVWPLWIILSVNWIMLKSLDKYFVNNFWVTKSWMVVASLSYIEQNESLNAYISQGNVAHVWGYLTVS